MTDPESQSTSALRTFHSPNGAQVQVAPHGGHICGWRTASGVERLYLSPLAKLDGLGAIRGGVPVIFPQFAGDGPLPKHGFARELAWQALELPPRADGQGAFAFELHDSPKTRAVFAHAFALRLDAVFSGETLEMCLTVQNTGSEPFAFTAALHTYFAVQRASAQLHGLENHAFTDSAAGGRLAAAEGEPVQFEGEIDRRYHAVPQPLVLRDARGAARISQTGFADVVVWNPGAALTKKIADLPADGFEHFVCVEAAAIERPVRLDAGARWAGTQKIELLE
ncbi:MAG: D-hexose-6-phosphate mutarotase [Burkholderiaceae bacterium]